MKKMKLAIILFSLMIVGCGESSSSSNSIKQESEAKIALGKLLYNDKSLSQNRTMACATCHAPEKGFIDERESPVGHAAAQSADGTKIADRNVPTASYTAYIPEFGTVKDGKSFLFVGGQFLDGRAKNLKEQAKGPFLNPAEMQMPNEASVMERVKENDTYIEQFRAIYGESIFEDINKSYDALADAISAFEKTEEFAPFDSKYDRYLKGEYKMSQLEQRGLNLFVDEEGGNCMACHPVATKEGNAGLFTDHSYDNLGVPPNLALRIANGLEDANSTNTVVDHGLLSNPAVNNKDLDGAFRVSSLRNVAVTAPYMHNGVFKELKTVVHFYNTRDVVGAVNPETGNLWRGAEVPLTVNHSEMGNLNLSDGDEDALVAFMKTLTDRRYE